LALPTHPLFSAGQQRVTPSAFRARKVPRVMLLYVVTEHPSVSQTFVVTEAAAVRASGAQVTAYALAPGSAGESAADLHLICRPPSRLRLLLAALRGGKHCLRVLWRARSYRPSLAEMTRLLLAQAHAEYAWPKVRTLNVEHIHAHFLGRTADVSLALAQKLGCAWTVTSHGADAYAPREPALLKRRLEHASGVVCANLGVQRAIERRLPGPSPRTCIVHCGVDVNSLAYQHGRSRHQTREIVTVGRLVATKGHWTILEAAHRLMRQDEALRWTIIGGGELFESLQADRRYRALYPRLHLAGPMDHRATLQRLGEGAAFVLPCEVDAHGGSDGIPVALMEAMALQP
jgi:colanic acid/amylovoran biosynthesis glycosyltransferase